jgi:DNA repair exonuclease SbcCD ATPase subunit
MSVPKAPDEVIHQNQQSPTDGPTTTPTPTSEAAVRTRINTLDSQAQNAFETSRTLLNLKNDYANLLADLKRQDRPQGLDAATENRLSAMENRLDAAENRLASLEQEVETNATDDKNLFAAIVEELDQLRPTLDRPQEKDDPPQAADQPEDSSTRSEIRQLRMRVRKLEDAAKAGPLILTPSDEIVELRKAVAQLTESTRALVETNREAMKKLDSHIKDQKSFEELARKHWV